MHFMHRKRERTEDKAVKNGGSTFKSLRGQKFRHKQYKSNVIFKSK